ncbi:hypothetical protein [Streptomyces sp. NPDC002845]
MISKLWETVSGSLAQRWLAASTLAAIFWFGGFLAWLYSRKDRSEVARLAEGYASQPAVVQVMLLLAMMAVVTGSGMVVGRMTEPALRIAEGYWPLWAMRLWFSRVDRAADARDPRAERWQELQGRIAAADPDLTPQDYAEFLRLERRQRYKASAPFRRMPTRVGAILRWAESRPFDKYGLESVAVWPRLWLVLPDATKRELVAARRAMDGCVAAGLWGVLFIGFAALTPWAVPVGLLITVLAMCVWLPSRALLFGELLEAAFDMHRILLYRQLRWPLPQRPSDEHAAGLALSQYLWRGSDATEPTFVDHDGGTGA